MRRPPGKGFRLILGAGGENGWVPNTTLIFKSKRNTGDYHDEMTTQHFEEWFQEKLIPNIPLRTLIVMDIASYHSRRSEPVPIQSWTKGKMQEWLTSKGVQYPTNALKSEMYDIIKRMKSQPRYDMASAAGHEVIRLPVAHCTLNPIEMAWAQVKRHIKTNARRFNLTEIEKLAWEGFDVVTAEWWGKLVDHVQDKVEEHYWTHDGLYESLVEEFVIRLGDDSDDSSSDLDLSDD